MSGWFRVHRAMWEHPVWSLSPGQRCVWFTCLRLAAYKPGEWWDGRERVKIAPGTFITSQDHLAAEAGVTRQIVRDALRNLERIGSIRTKTRTKRWTLIEIVNWDTYQGGGAAENPDANQPRTHGEPTGNHIGRMQEGKNGKTERRQTALPTGGSRKRGGLRHPSAPKTPTPFHQDG